MDENSVDWKAFEMSVDLHRLYLEFAVKLNLFYYAITGGILSFHFARESPKVSAIGLLLPTILSLFLGGFFLYSASLAWHLRAAITMNAKKLGLTVYPEGIVLVTLCVIFGIVMLSVGFVLVGYLLWGWSSATL